MVVQLGQRRMALSGIALIERRASRPLNLLTVGELQQQNKSSRHPERVLRSAQWMHHEIPLRLAHRLKDFHRLPYVALSCEPFAKVHGLYMDAFDALSACPEITSLEHVEAFSEALRAQVDAHKQVVPLMEQAIGELSPFEDCKAELSQFWDKLFVTRIGNRVLAEHFLAWLDGKDSDGIVTDCELEPLVRRTVHQLTELTRSCYGHCPDVLLDVSCRGSTVPVIPDHVRYITQEVLKNAIRATVESHGSAKAPPVKVCIHQGTFDTMIKISDRGGGLPKHVERRLWEYGFTTANRSRRETQIAGYGVGLPLARLYARYFGGDINVHHMYGHGTEVLINLNRLGESQELDVSSASDSDREPLSSLRFPRGLRTTKGNRSRAYA